MKKNTTMLMILDGFGYSENAGGNAIAAADTPHIDALLDKYPHTLLGASGSSVGLPDGQMGNSEVGHLYIGAGRIIYQDLSRITLAIKDGSFFQNKVLLQAMKNAGGNVPDMQPGADDCACGDFTPPFGGADDCACGDFVPPFGMMPFGADSPVTAPFGMAPQPALHLMGLLSDGGVHSHIDHLFALIDMAVNSGVRNICIHGILDGRDVPPRCALKYIEELEEKIAGIRKADVRTATISGRYYTMDRDKRWDRVQKAYDALTSGIGETAPSAAAAVANAYERGENDEFVLPTVIERSDGAIRSGDSVIMFNFRPDRAREITRTLCDPDFSGFERSVFPADLTYVCMTEYEAEMPNVTLAYPPEHYDNTLGEYLAGLGKTQLRLAETEKYAHVTFFMNGGVEEPNKNEDRILIPSPKVATYDLQPEMSAYLLRDEAIKALESGRYDLIIMNFANPDMVGHTGIFEAAVSAIETIDTCVNDIAEAAEKCGASLFITADHGNADTMIDDAGNPITKHSTNPVPAIVIMPPYDGSLNVPGANAFAADGCCSCSESPDAGSSASGSLTASGLRSGGILADIAPTLLQMMGLPQPAEMTGRSIIE